MRRMGRLKHLLARASIALACAGLSPAAFAADEQITSGWVIADLPAANGMAAARYSMNYMYLDVGEWVIQGYFLEHTTPEKIVRNFSGACWGDGACYARWSGNAGFWVFPMSAPVVDDHHMAGRVPAYVSVGARGPGQGPPGRDGRDGQDGRDGKDGRGGGTTPSDDSPMPATGYCAVGADIITFSDGSIGSLDVNAEGVINLEDLRGFERIFRQGSSTLTAGDIAAIERYLDSVGQQCVIRQVGTVTPPVTDPDPVTDPPPPACADPTNSLWDFAHTTWDWCDASDDWRALFEADGCEIYRWGDYLTCQETVAIPDVLARQCDTVGSKGRCYHGDTLRVIGGFSKNIRLPTTDCARAVALVSNTWDLCVLPGTNPVRVVISDGAFLGEFEWGT